MEGRGQRQVVMAAPAAFGILPQHIACQLVPFFIAMRAERCGNGANVIPPLVKAVEVLKDRGAKNVYAYCTHPIFSGPAIDRIAQGSALDEVVVTNTIPLSAHAAACQKIRQLSVGPLVAETIQRIAKGESVMSLFSDQN